MLIHYPRVPLTEVVRGRIRYKIGPAQAAALRSLIKTKPGQEAPKGLITAAGFVRKHIYNDLLPFEWVRAKVIKPGVVDYVITKLGMDVYENRLVEKEAPAKVKAPAGKAPSLLDKQRARAAARRKAQEAAAAAGKSRKAA